MGRVRKNSDSQERNSREQKKLAELTDEQREKFDLLVMPNIKMIRQLVAYYSTNPTYFDDNYSCVLEELVRYIDNFDMNRIDKLSSWLHVVVKNCVNKHNERNKRFKQILSDVPYEEYTSNFTLVASNHSNVNLFDGISDEVYNALMKIPASKLEPLLYSIQGYTIKEIIAIEMENGNLKEPSEAAIKCRIFTAKSILYKELYGTKRTKNKKNNKGVSKGGKRAGQ